LWSYFPEEKRNFTGYGTFFQPNEKDIQAAKPFKNCILETATWLQY